MDGRVSNLLPHTRSVYYDLLLAPILQGSHIGDNPLDVLEESGGSTVPDLLKVGILGPPSNGRL